MLALRRADAGAIAAQLAALIEQTRRFSDELGSRHREDVAAHTYSNDYSFGGSSSDARLQAAAEAHLESERASGKSSDQVLRELRTLSTTQRATRNAQLLAILKFRDVLEEMIANQVLAPQDGLLAPQDGLLAPQDGWLAPQDGLLAPQDYLLAPQDGLLAHPTIAHQSIGVARGGVELDQELPLLLDRRGLPRRGAELLYVYLQSYGFEHTATCQTHPQAPKAAHRLTRVTFDLDFLTQVASFSMSYGFEYMGANTRLVISGDQKRCFTTAMSAFNYHLGVAAVGGGGSGKSSLIPDLCAALGQQYFVFNCTDEFR